MTRFTGFALGVMMLGTTVPGFSQAQQPQTQSPQKGDQNGGDSTKQTPQSSPTDQDGKAAKQKGKDGKGKQTPQPTTGPTVPDPTVK